MDVGSNEILRFLISIESFFFFTLICFSWKDLGLYIEFEIYFRVEGRILLNRALLKKDPFLGFGITAFSENKNVD